jgi:hypothetical protein
MGIQPGNSDMTDQHDLADAREIKMEMGR